MSTRYRSRWPSAASTHPSGTWQRKTKHTPVHRGTNAQTYLCRVRASYKYKCTVSSAFKYWYTDKKIPIFTSTSSFWMCNRTEIPVNSSCYSKTHTLRTYADSVWSMRCFGICKSCQSINIEYTDSLFKWLQLLARISIFAEESLERRLVIIYGCYLHGYQMLLQFSISIKVWDKILYWRFIFLQDKLTVMQSLRQSAAKRNMLTQDLYPSDASRSSSCNTFSTYVSI